MKEKEYSDIFSGFKGAQTDLIPILVRIQDKAGYISEQSVRQVSGFLKMSENQIYGVASFYPKFRFTRPGRKSIKVCMGTACHVRGGLFLSEAVGWKLGIAIGQTTEDMRFDFQRAGCLGCCTLAPVVKINEDVHSRMSVTRLKEILEKDD
ncbi:MAG: NAD(P)H-dependent oxidoreductase subunit E [Candidatus Zixiibacteriota bacterium]|nr:MAG: NAD(P)H-dependent oxidoreductase subunit E [candidate division Zixibacteria bacterium]